MKSLLLLRHAKSSWDDPALADFQRPLAPRGLKAAKRAGRELARRGWLPDKALISAAVRTRQTWQLVAAELPQAPPHESSEGLYDASADRILAEVQRTAAGIDTLLVLGHNPGLESLARRLADDESDADALARLREKFPTAAVVRFILPGSWRDLAKARLTHCLKPKDRD